MIKSKEDLESSTEEVFTAWVFIPPPINSLKVGTGVESETEGLMDMFEGGSNEETKRPK